MVGVGRRMNKLKAQLLNIRVGPGAAHLPSDITRIHMEFAKRWNDGHYGPRKFWQECLPRLKYWNPAVPMIVNRTHDNTGPSIMTIYFRRSEVKLTAPLVTPDNQPSSSFLGNSKAPEPLAEERTVQIDMKNVQSEAILQDFLAKTSAVPVTPTAEEEADLQEVKARLERSQADREVMAKHNAVKRREAAIMAQARSEAAAMKQAL